MPESEAEKARKILEGLDDGQGGESTAAATLAPESDADKARSILESLGEPAPDGPDAEPESEPARDPAMDEPIGVTDMLATLERMGASEIGAAEIQERAKPFIPPSMGGGGGGALGVNLRGFREANEAREKARTQIIRERFAERLPGVFTRGVLTTINDQMDLALANQTARSIAVRGDRNRDVNLSDPGEAELQTLMEVVDAFNPVVEERHMGGWVDRVRGRIEDPEKAREFIEALAQVRRDEIEEASDELFLISTVGAFVKSMTFGALDAAEHMPKDEQQLLVEYQESASFLEKAGIAGAGLAPAIVNVGALSKGFFRGLSKVPGMKPGVAQGLASTSAMTVFGASMGQDPVEAAVAGFLAPLAAQKFLKMSGALAVTSDRVAGSTAVAALQSQFAESVAFIGYAAATHGLGDLDDVAIDMIFGAVMGSRPGAVRRVKAQNAVDRLKTIHMKWSKARGKVRERRRQEFIKEFEAAVQKVRDAKPALPSGEGPRPAGALPARASGARPELPRGAIRTPAPATPEAPAPTPTAADLARLRRSRAEAPAEAPRNVGDRLRGRPQGLADDVVPAEQRARSAAQNRAQGLASPDAPVVERPGRRGVDRPPRFSTEPVVKETPQGVEIKHPDPVIPQEPLAGAKAPVPDVAAPAPKGRIPSRREQAENAEALDAFAGDGPGGKPLGSEAGVADVGEVLSLPREAVRRIGSAAAEIFNFKALAEAVRRPGETTARAVRAAANPRIITRSVARKASDLRSALAGQDPTGGRRAAARDAEAALESGGGDANRTAASFTAEKSQRSYADDAARIESKAAMQLQKALKDDPATNARVQEYMEGARTADNLAREGVSPDIIAQAKRLRGVMDDLHNRAVELGGVSKDSDSVYGPGTHPDGGGRHIRRSYLERIESELGVGAGALIPRQRRKRDKFTVRLPDGSKENFHILDFKGTEGAKAAASRFARQNKGKIVGKPPLDADARADLGEIRDAGYNIARTIQLQSGLVAKLEFLANLAGNKKLSMGGRREGGAIVPEGPLPRRFHPEPLPDTPAYGALRGKFVHKKVRDEIMAMFGENGFVNNSIVRFAEAANSLLKQGKTVFNPPTHMRNAVGNFTTFAELAPNGLSALSPVDWGWLRKAHRVWAAKPGTPEFGMLKILTAGGVGRNQGALKQLLPYMGELEATGAPNYAKAKGALGAAKRAGKSGVDAARTIYAYEDEIFKIAYALKQYAHLTGGKKPLPQDQAIKQAIRLTNRYFPNYVANPMAALMSSKGAMATLARNTVAPPFLSFEFESARIMATHAMERPLSVAAGFWMLGEMGSAMAETLGLGDDDVDQIRTSTPDWIQPGTPVTPMLPFVSDGKLYNLDGRFTLPGAEWYLAADRFRRGQDSTSGTYVDLFANSLLLSPIADIAQGRDRFTGRDLFGSGETAVSGAAEGDLTNIQMAIQYMTEAYLPPLTPGPEGVRGRGFKRLVEGATGADKTTNTGETSRGETFRSKANFWVELHNNVLPLFLGSRLNEIDLEKSRDAKALVMRFRANDLKKNLRDAIHNGQTAKEARLRQELEDLSKEADRLSVPLSASIRRALGK